VPVPEQHAWSKESEICYRSDWRHDYFRSPGPPTPWITIPAALHGSDVHRTTGDHSGEPQWSTRGHNRVIDRLNYVQCPAATIQWLKWGVARGAQPTLLRLGPHLLKSEPGLLIAEPMLLQQLYDIYFFVSELIALMTVLKSHYYEAWFVIFSWFYYCRFICVRISINRLNFSFTGWVLWEIWQLKCTKLFPPGLVPRPRWGSHNPIVGWGGGYPTVSRPEPPLLHTSTLTTATITNKSMLTEVT